MNQFTAVCNLCADPEELTLGDKNLTKLRLADNTFGKNNEARFFDALIGGPDKETAMKLAQGDQIVITGTLVRSSYKAKKDGKGIKKGQKIYTDSMPFARILQVTKSDTFFAGGEEAEESESTGNTEEPSLEAPPADEGDAGADPLEGVV